MTAKTKDTVADLEHARSELARIEPLQSRDALNLVFAAGLGAAAAATAYVLGADALPSTLVGGAIVAVSAAVQAKLSLEREEQRREDEEKWFELRMVLNRSRGRLLRQDEALTLVAALGTIGDSKLDAQIRGRVMSELPAACSVNGARVADAGSEEPPQASPAPEELDSNLTRPLFEQKPC